MENQVPRWALLLFDTDGCTLATRTASLQVSDDDIIEVGQVRQFRHGRDVYLVEILALSDTKQELNEFERDWQVTGRSDAIQSAKSNEQVGNFLKIPSSDINNLETRIECSDTVSAELQSEVHRLRENQERIMANQQLLLTNQSVLVEAVLSIKDLLSTRVKKATRLDTNSDTTPAPPHSTTARDPIPAPPCPVTNVTDCPPAQPELETTTATTPVPLDVDIPELDFDIPEILSIIATPTMTQIPPESEPAGLQTVDYPTINMNCVRELNFSSVERSSLNIGSVRNPVVVDSAKFEKAKLLPTAQRFILAVMDLVFTNDELAESSVMGGTVKYNGILTMKKALCRFKRNAILHQAALLFDKSADQLQTDVSIRNAMNSKCRSKRHGNKPAS